MIEVDSNTVVRARLLAKLREAHASLGRGMRGRQREAGLRNAAECAAAGLLAVVIAKALVLLATGTAGPWGWGTSLTVVLLGAGLGFWRAGAFTPLPLDLARVAELWDHQAKPHHSVAAALEFSLAPQSAWEWATVHAGTREAETLTLPVVPPSMGEPPVRAVLGGLGALLLAILLANPWGSPSEAAAKSRSLPELTKASQMQPVEPTEDSGSPTERSVPIPGRDDPERQNLTQATPGIAPTDPAFEKSPDIAPRPGQFGQGTVSSELRSGMPEAGQGDASEGAKTLPEPATKKPIAKPRKDPPTQTRKLPEKGKREAASGATVGQGTSGGGAMSPVKSPWSQKDQSEDRPLAENPTEESVDEEIGEEEARSGTQPATKDRRGATSRDLSISGPGEGGEGRGGPTPQKKARGVGSLILGLPIPDFVRGLLNPGTTKVTYERVPPLPALGATWPAAPTRGRSRPEPSIDLRAPTEARKRALREWLLKFHR